MPDSIIKTPADIPEGSSNRRSSSGGVYDSEPGTTGKKLTIESPADVAAEVSGGGRTSSPDAVPELIRDAAKGGKVSIETPADVSRDL